ncbi:D-sedoheptulose-7-phosphate isomerase [Vulgatibacter incomptus]|uniref:Phosphoheptose isomerase 1 n=1 Tax=Vulgatibacter incomptus TaxID=1391653 RepID=A0A0K1P9D0_9BACT|nr:SIS domain-containing protein [Vulgatibacter incomptus]AKU90143.1 Phosphoheptose isomerase 1 [Vulgatibacter incomptus]
MRDSIVRKARESAELSARFVERAAGELERCTAALAIRFREGGRLLVMGNGGSACDAQHVSVEFNHPIVEKRRPLPAQALGTDVAWLTAIGNDTDFSRVYLEQLEAMARPMDSVLGISTSGASTNVNHALRRARELGLLTIGFAGRDGGAMVDLCDFSFVAPSWSVHRIQEVHTLLLHLLWDHVHVSLGEDDVL